MPHMHPCKTKPEQQTYLVLKTAGRTTTSDTTHPPSLQSPPRCRSKQRRTNVKPPPADFIPTTTIDEPLNESWQSGDVINYVDLRPITPASSEGCTKVLAFRDTRFKYLFTYPVKTKTEEIFLYFLERVLRFFTTRGYKPRILRSEYYITFRSNKAIVAFYEDHHCTHESSTPYQQWQNAVERDIQTLLANVSATIHSQDFLRADTWAHAVRHWHRLHNLVPQHPSIKDIPARRELANPPNTATQSPHGIPETNNLTYSDYAPPRR